MLNRIVLIGRLTKDPELRYTPTGVAVLTFTLAVDRNYKNAQGERDTDFIPCVVYRQLAELYAETLFKGKMVSVDGRLKVRSYMGNDGQKRWITEVIAEFVEFLSPKDTTSNHDEIQESSSDNQDGYNRDSITNHTIPSITQYYGTDMTLDDDIPY